MKRRHLVFAILVLVAVFSAFLLAERGMTESRSVIVRLKGENGALKDVKLYSGSYALVIGVSKYEEGWPSLRGVTEDVREVEKSLKGKGFEVKVLRNPSSFQLESGIKDFGSGSI